MLKRVSVSEKSYKKLKQTVLFIHFGVPGRSERLQIPLPKLSENGVLLTPLDRPSKPWDVIPTVDLQNGQIRLSKFLFLFPQIVPDGQGGICWTSLFTLAACFTTSARNLYGFPPVPPQLVTAAWSGPVKGSLSRWSLWEALDTLSLAPLLPSGGAACAFSVEPEGRDGQPHSPF